MNSSESKFRKKFENFQMPKFKSTFFLSRKPYELNPETKRLQPYAFKSRDIEGVGNSDSSSKVSSLS